MEGATSPIRFERFELLEPSEQSSGPVPAALPLGRSFVSTYVKFLSEAEMNRKWLIAIFALIVAWPSFSRAATMAELASYNKPDREKVLYEGAKKEGKLMWYTSLTGGPNLEAPKLFEMKYPGIKMEVYRGDGDALIARILQEAQAKRFLVDTIETTFPILKVIKDEKLIVPFFSPYLSAYPDDVKEKGDKEIGRAHV